MQESLARMQNTDPAPGISMGIPGVLIILTAMKQGIGSEIVMVGATVVPTTMTWQSQTDSGSVWGMHRTITR